MRRSAVLVLLFLAVSAGCSLPFGPDSDGTSTPADASLSAAEAPPGVSAEERRVTNATALTTAHTKALVADGFESDVRTNATVFQRGRVQRVERRQRTVVEPDRAQYVYRVTNPGARIDGWGNRSLRVVRAQAGDRTSYRVRSDPVTPRQLSGVATVVGPCLDDGFAVTDVVRDDDGTHVELRSDTLPDERCVLPRNATNVTDYEARAIVDRDGRIHRFAVAADYTLRGEDGHVLVTFDLVRSEVDGFDRPDWVDTALAEAA